MAIEYGKRRAKESFTDDRALIRLYAVKEELDRIINLYYEKMIGMGPYTGSILEGTDPCALFRALGELPDKDDTSAMIRSISHEGTNMCVSRTTLTEFLSRRIRELMPNLTDLAGEDLALDLLSRAGGMDRLALMPASTIQVLGADRSFFKHIRTGSPPPKHGVLFKYTQLSSLPKRLRGKYSRYVAAKLAIAARADFHGTRIDTTTTKKKIEERLKQIRTGSAQARTGKHTSHRGSVSGRNR